MNFKNSSGEWSEMTFLKIQNLKTLQQIPYNLGTPFQASSSTLYDDGSTF